MSLAPSDPRHGTRNGYTNLGCRCTACRAAQRISHSEWRHRTGRSLPRGVWAATRRAEAEARDNHGTETRYQLGCRCGACKRASNAARAARRKNPNVAVHGSQVSYSNGCRCDSCRAANTTYSRERKRRRRAAA